MHTCKTCKHFDSEGDDTFEGRCRRNTPRASLEGLALWPEVTVSDWCGRYERDAFASATAPLPLHFPPGDYLFKIVSSMVDHAAHPPRLVWTLEIAGGPGPGAAFNGAQLAHVQELSDRGAPYIRKLILACGTTEQMLVNSRGEIDPSMIHGKQFVGEMHDDRVRNERPIPPAPNGN
jgi:hypothetical protein